MGFSYKNVYGSEKYSEFIGRQRYLLDDKFFADTENYELSDGFSLEIIEYEETEEQRISSAYKCILRNSGKVIYKYCCLDSHNFVFKDIIHHSNGHRYYLFKVDLYGISCLDIDTLEVYSYIPEGCEHSEEYPYGESFIVTDVHYDEKSNLIAYGGCYWAAPSDIMAGDFSNPLDFNPHLISLHDIIDPDYDLYDDIDFKEWKNGRLYVLCDNKTEKSVSTDELIDIIKEQSK
ncbi:MAG: hypothetical protein NC340_04990 [Ruminococcus flavefaciens]|nr:hypothetical protein [Ruminococcus flavefaciens]MCM1228979.1 hypothetical protein [Ruminococcus flavefaciens]